MSGALDERAVERAAEGLALALPRVPHRGRAGDARAASVGASMEIHDFRAYQPGDDLRQVDWNAVARTGELILRVRKDEVAPRVELVLDGSRSMALTAAKASRARELALLVCKLALRQGLEPSVVVTSRVPQRAAGAGVVPVVKGAAFDAADDLGVALRRSPPLRPCGLRVVVSDLLFDAPLDTLAERLARDAAGLALVQLLDAEDEEPSGGQGARLEDVETGEALERVLTPALLESYRRRLEAHQRLVGAAARRVAAVRVTVAAALDIEELARRHLSPLVVPAKAR